MIQKTEREVRLAYTGFKQLGPGVPLLSLAKSLKPRQKFWSKAIVMGSAELSLVFMFAS